MKDLVISEELAAALTVISKAGEDSQRLAETGYIEPESFAIFLEAFGLSDRSEGRELVRAAVQVSEKALAKQDVLVSSPADFASDELESGSTGRHASIDRRRLLANVPLFGRLEPEELDRLVTYMRLVRHPARTSLFRKGDPGSNMMVVVRGRIKVCSHSEDGKELVLNLINAGEVVGEIALLDGSDRTADAVTLTETELLVLERRDFIPFLQRHPEVCMRLFEVLCERLRKTSELLEEALFLEGSSRLAKRLVYLAEVFGKPVPGGVRIDIPLSQQQLGNMVAMSRESMNKQLKQWRQDGLIRTEDGHYVLTDLDALRAI